MPLHLQASALGDIVLTVEHLDHQLLAGEVRWRCCRGWGWAGEQWAGTTATATPMYAAAAAVPLPRPRSLPERHAAPPAPTHPCLQSDTVLIQTRVLVVNEAPAGPGSDPETLGSFTDSICVKLASLDNMLPGSGFAIHSHMFRWHKPIVARTRGLLGTKQCRVQ